MSRYFVQRQPERAYWYDNGPLLPDIGVPEHVATDTGLVDKRGDPIMRAPRPVGFGRMEEW
jgi:hypothetical protein